MSKEIASASVAEKIIEAYENGYSDVEICRILKITQKKFDSMYNSNAAFMEMVDIGRAMSKAWWYAKGRENIDNTKFNTTLWAFNMKNRYAWADKTESVNTNSNYEDVSLDALHAQMRKMLPGILKDVAPDLPHAKVIELDAVRSN